MNVVYVQCATHPTMRAANSPVAGVPVREMLAGYVAAAERRSAA